MTVAFLRISRRLLLNSAKFFAFEIWIRRTSGSMKNRSVRRTLAMARTTTTTATGMFHASAGASVARTDALSIPVTSRATTGDPAGPGTPTDVIVYDPTTSWIARVPLPAASASTCDRSRWAGKLLVDVAVTQASPPGTATPAKTWAGTGPIGFAGVTASPSTSQCGVDDPAQGRRVATTRTRTWSPGASSHDGAPFHLGACRARSMARLTSMEAWAGATSSGNPVSVVVDPAPVPSSTTPVWSTTTAISICRWSRSSSSWRWAAATGPAPPTVIAVHSTDDGLSYARDARWSSSTFAWYRVMTLTESMATISVTETTMIETDCRRISLSRNDMDFFSDFVPVDDASVPDPESRDATEIGGPSTVADSAAWSWATCGVVDRFASRFMSTV